MASSPPPDEVSDEALLCRIAEDRDKRALATLMTRCAPKATGYLKKQFDGRLRDPEIEQAVNDAVFNVWRFASGFKPEKSSFRSWFTRIVQRAALNILRGDKGHVAKELEFSPEHDPADHCEEDPPEFASKSAWRVAQMDDIIDNELMGFEQILARADAAVGGTADSKRLATEYGKSLNTVYATRSKVRDNIRSKILEREAGRVSTKGTK